MGCVVCNITSCEEFEQGETSIRNPFYCKTKRELKEFIEELAYDIAQGHPEIVRKINSYVKKLNKSLEKQTND